MRLYHPRETTLSRSFNETYYRFVSYEQAYINCYVLCESTLFLSVIMNHASDIIYQHSFVAQIYYFCCDGENKPILCLISLHHTIEKVGTQHVAARSTQFRAHQTLLRARARPRVDVRRGVHARTCDVQATRITQQLGRVHYTSVISCRGYTPVISNRPPRHQSLVRNPVLEWTPSTNGLSANSY